MLGLRYGQTVWISQPVSRIKVKKSFECNFKDTISKLAAALFMLNAKQEAVNTNINIVKSLWFDQVKT